MKSKKDRLKPAKLQSELAYARQRWPEQWNPQLAARFESLLQRTRLRLSQGELVVLDGGLYVTHAGLLSLARRNRCAGIHTEIIDRLSRPQLCHWVVRATVFKTPRSTRGFAGLGDANPDNVSPLVRGLELRVAETRAVNRALRKAYAIGICSAEELGTPSPAPAFGVRLQLPKLGPRSAVQPLPVAPPASVQDRLKLLLRDHELDPAQVLGYACRFLGVSEISEAPAHELRRFTDHLEQLAIASPAWLRAELRRDLGGGTKQESTAGTGGEAA